MKPDDVTSGTCINFNKRNNKEDPKLKVDDHVRISKYKNILTKGYVPNWSVQVLQLKILIILWRGHVLLVMLLVKKLLE